MASTPIISFLLKVTNNCNFDCDHCYFRNHADKSYRHRPAMMSDEIIGIFTRRLGEYVREESLERVEILFHGGEPLLQPAAFFDRAVNRIRKALPFSCESCFSIQTNASLLDKNWIECLTRNRISLSVSIDGPMSAQDRHRRLADGRSSFDVVHDNIRRILDDASGRSVLGGALSVVDLRNDPAEVFQFHRDLGIPSVDYLWPDGHHARLPPGIRDFATDIAYGKWSASVFDAWFSEGTGLPSIRFFQNMMSVMLGGTSGIEGIGPGSLSLLTIQTDGEIQDSDVLAVAYEHAARFGTGYYIQNSTLREVIRSTAFAEHAARFDLAGLCDMCQSCRWRDMCGGGMLPHRYGAAHGFNAPSIYCGSLAYLLAHVESVVLREVDQAKDRGPTKIHDQVGSDTTSLGRENRMDNVLMFLEEWDSDPAECRREEDLRHDLSAEHVNVDGDIGNPTSLILTPCDQGFMRSIERGVARLVHTLVYRLGLVTYSSCQGHAIAENDCRERTVGILPRSEEERRWVRGLLRCIGEISEILDRDTIHVRVEDDAVEDSGGQYATVEIVFARDGRSATDYLTNVDEAYNHFNEILESLTNVVCPDHLVAGAPIHVQQQWELYQRRKRTDTNDLKELRVPITLKEEPSWDVADTIKQQVCNLDVLTTRQDGNTMVLRHRGSLYPDERLRVARQVSRSEIVVVNNHAWALSAWLRLLSGRASATATRKVVVTHLDYHADMMVPLLFGTNASKVFGDAVTGQSVRLENVETVDEAIASTAIGPGSFILPFVAAFPATRVLHVIPAGQRTNERPALRDGGTIPWLESPMSWSTFEDRGASWSQASHPSCLSPNDDETWIVDIDLDYFDNSLGGNAGNATVTRLTVPSQLFAERIALVREWLASLLRRPDVVTLALSADFCPLEVSVEALRALLPLLQNMIGQRGGDPTF